MLVKPKNVNWNYTQFLSMADKEDTLRFDHPIQRQSDQWNANQKSLYIDSLLNNFPIFPIFFLRSFEQRNGKMVAVREVLDGQQRLTVGLSYLKNEFALTEDIAPIELHGELYELAGKYYSELDETVQAHFTTRTLLTYTFDEEDTSEEQIEEIFNRLNNSKGLTAHQKTKAIMGTKFARLVNVAKSHELFPTYGNFPASALKNDEHLTAILQAMMLIEGFEFKKFSTAEVTRYSKTVRTDFEKKSNVIAAVESTLDYLFEAFGGKRELPVEETTNENEDDAEKLEKPKKAKKPKNTHIQKLLLKKINFPMTVALANKARQTNVDASMFSLWAVAFEDAVNGKETNNSTNYLEYTGVGSTDLVKVKGRVNEMERHFNAYMELFNK